MALTLFNRHPLENLLSTTPVIRAVDHMDVIRGAAIVTVLATGGEEKTVAAALDRISDVHVRRTGPGEWLVVALHLTPDNLLRTLSTALLETAYLVDQSDGRIVVRLSGPNARRILAKGVAIDLHPSVFVPGASATLLCGQILVTLTRTDDNEFEILTARSTAQSFLEALRAMGREFDLSVGFRENTNP